MSSTRSSGDSFFGTPVHLSMRLNLFYAQGSGPGARLWWRIPLIYRVFQG